MRERAAIYGGTVRADSGRDGGFEVTARLPLPVVAPDEDTQPAGRQPAGRQPRGWPSRGAA